MAKKEKSSFFGKIMGGNVADESSQSDVSQRVQTVLEAEELAPDDAVEEREVVIEETVTEAPAKEKTANEDWMSDYEGQVNIDMYQTKDNVIIKSTIAGGRPEDIDITVANDMVTIKGSRRKEENINQDDYFYQECYWGSFSRSIILPVDIEAENASAEMKDGILTIRLPKAEKVKTKKIKVIGK